MQKVELAAVCAKFGRMPTVTEYLETVGDKLTKNADNIYRYLNFHLMPEYKIFAEKAKKTIPIAEVV